MTHHFFVGNGILPHKPHQILLLNFLLRKFASPAARWLLVCVVCSVCAISIWAHPTVGKQGLDTNKRLTQYHLTTWNSDNGLPNNYVLAILQTHDGYIWFGTFGGLVRFDGLNFTVFNTSNTPQMQSHAIRALYEDAQGRLWIGTNGGGIVMMHNGVCKNWTTKQGLRSNVFTSFCELPNGTLAATSFQGVHCFQSGELTTTPPEFEQFNTCRLNRILVDHAKTLWIATEDMGLVHFHATGVQRYTTQDGLNARSVSSLLEDDEHRIWIGTNQGMYRLEPNNTSTNNANKQNVNKNHANATVHKIGALNMIISNILYDHNRSIWAASNNGLYRFMGDRIDALTAQQGISDADMYSLCEDTEGNLWVGGYRNGVFRLRDSKFLTYGMSEGLAGDVVYSIVPDPKAGGFLVGSNAGLQHLANGVFTSLGLPFQKSNMVRCAIRDSNGTLWAGTFGGLYHLEHAAKRWKLYTETQGLAGNFVRALHADRTGGVWIGTRSGLSYWKNGIFSTLTTKHGLAANSIVSLHEDRAGNLWIGLDGSGLDCKTSTGEIRHYSTANGLTTDIVFFVYEDKHGSIWACTNGGLNVIRAGTITQFTARDGLPDDAVHCVMEDDLGNMWIGTSAGIFRVAYKDLQDFADKRISKVHGTLFTKDDAMRTNACTAPSTPCKTSDGKLWFATLKGIVVIDPAHIRHNRTPPPVLVLNVVSNGKQVHIAPNDTLKSLHFAAGTDKIEFHYTALHYTAPGKVQFQYLLSDFDAEWTTTATQRIAYYTNIPPGEYMFRVLACNNDGVWNTTGAKVRIVIEPFFYETRWFYILCGGLVLASGISAYRFRVRHIERRNRKLERIVQERTIELRRSNAELSEANDEIFRQNQILEEQTVMIEYTNAELQEKNLTLEQLNRDKNEFLGIAAHDLKNPLTGITMTTMILQQYFQKFTPEEIIARVKDIQDSAERMTAIIMMLLDFNAIESGKLHLKIDVCNVSTIAAQTLEAYKERATQKRITLHSTIPPDVSAIADKVALSQVLENLVSNAIKFSPEGNNVYLNVMHNNNAQNTSTVRVSVRDEGPGMTAEDKEKLFGRYTKLSARPTGGEHSTGLGLSIVKRLVETMHGRVWCESELGNGAEFIVELRTQL